ncbi:MULTISPECIES: YfhO family protein [Clostridium]|uniref:YfhO family protein n=1 Tax=Clostridium TaxID=1485 RepID=UPI0008245425|nr:MULTISPECIES: YfhO family protein [Clostridium]
MTKLNLKNYYVKAFILGILTASIIIIPFIICGHGILHIVDDFNLQQIPFNIQSNLSIKSGNIGWNWNNDLGSSFIGSYSFYTLGSVFFWISMLFPAYSFPYLIGPLLILKFAVAVLTAFAFMKRFVKNKNYAILGGLLYAFSGFQIINMMFNHFNDVTALFPLLLIALEEFVINDRKVIFALVVALSALTNFFFFIGEVVFLIIYFFCRLFEVKFRSRMNLKKFLLLIFEGILGVGISCTLFIPSIMFTLKNPRVHGILKGIHAILYSGVIDYLNIIKAVLMPAEIASSKATFMQANFNSTEAFIPVFGLILVFAYIWHNKKSWLSIALYVCTIFALVPVLNTAFTAFNPTYYSRWFYMFVMLMALASVKALDERHVDYKKGLVSTIMLWLIFTGMTFYARFYKEITIVYNRKQFAFYIALAITGFLITFVLLKLKSTHKDISKVSIILVIIFAAITGMYNIHGNEKLYPSPKRYNNIYELSSKKVKLPKTYDYRIDNLACYLNINLMWNVPSIQSFNSTISGSLFDFYSSVNVPRLVMTQPPYKYYGLRPFLSVKYTAVTKGYSKLKMLRYFGKMKLPDVSLYEETPYYYIYKNNDFIPFGYTFDKYITQEDYNKTNPNIRHLEVLKALVLNDSQANQYGSSMSRISDSDLNNVSKSQYKKDVEDRKKESSYYFKRDGDGFTSKIKLKKSNLVFFSVPYDEDWSAQVNGKWVNVEKVDSGLMAVKGEAGNNTIHFMYTNKGLKIGKRITFLSIIILLIYACILKFYYAFKKAVKSF